MGLFFWEITFLFHITRRLHVSNISYIFQGRDADVCFLFVLFLYESKTGSIWSEDKLQVASRIRVAGPKDWVKVIFFHLDKATYKVFVAEKLKLRQLETLEKFWLYLLNFLC